MSCDCEFKRYYSFKYLPGDKEREHPYIDAPYEVDFFDKMNCSYGIGLCKLTAEHRSCTAEHKECCSRYKKHLEYISRPKIPCIWNSETKRREYGIRVDYNNWNW